MHKTAQAWFSGGPSNDLDAKTTSLLADWNAYAASSNADDGDPSAFDLEAAVRTANDKVTSTFSVLKHMDLAEEKRIFQKLGKTDGDSCPSLFIFQANAYFPSSRLFSYFLIEASKVSKGVRELPGSFNSATSNVPSGKSLLYFGFFLAAGVFFIFIAFTIFLPVMVLKPQKFAICFTIGCAFIVGSFFALKGPRSQLSHMLSKERLPFTLGFLGSIAGTIYVSMVLHSYILSILFSVLQVLALSYYCISYFPGGSAGLKFLSSTLASSVLRCFGR